MSHRLAFLEKSSAIRLVVRMLPRLPVNLSALDWREATDIPHQFPAFGHEIIEIVHKLRFHKPFSASKSRNTRNRRSIRSLGLRC